MYLLRKVLLFLAMGRRLFSFGLLTFMKVKLRVMDGNLLPIPKLVFEFFLCAFCEFFLFLVDPADHEDRLGFGSLSFLRFLNGYLGFLFVPAETGKVVIDAPVPALL